MVELFGTFVFGEIESKTQFSCIENRLLYSMTSNISEMGKYDVKGLKDKGEKAWVRVTKNFHNHTHK